MSFNCHFYFYSHLIITKNDFNHIKALNSNIFSLINLNVNKNFLYMPFILKQSRFISILTLLIFTTLIASAQSKAPWVAPSNAADVKNPLAGNTETLKYAKVLYTSYCSPCHGEKGKGDGIAAPGLQVKPADHTSQKVQSQSDGSLFWMMSEGRTPMPAYKTVLNENQRWELVNYIRALAKK